MPSLICSREAISHTSHRVFNVIVQKLHDIGITSGNANRVTHLTEASDSVRGIFPSEEPRSLQDCGFVHVIRNSRPTEPRGYLKGLPSRMYRKRLSTDRDDSPPCVSGTIFICVLRFKIVVIGCPRGCPRVITGCIRLDDESSFRRNVVNPCDIRISYAIFACLNRRILPEPTSTVAIDSTRSGIDRVFEQIEIELRSCIAQLVAKFGHCAITVCHCHFSHPPL